MIGGPGMVIPFPPTALDGAYGVQYWTFSPVIRCMR